MSGKIATADELGEELTDERPADSVFSGCLAWELLEMKQSADDRR